MSTARRKPKRKEHISVDGWISTRKHNNYEFKSVTHLEGEELDRKCTPRKVTPTKKIGEEKKTSGNFAKVTNPYKTQTTTCTKDHSPTKCSSEKKELKDPQPAPLSLIRAQNKLYFSYDPRGYPTDPLPQDFCKHCRCPNIYCAEVVFGHISIDHAQTLAYTSGPHSTLDCVDMKEMFDRAYTKLVFAKLGFNGFVLTVSETQTSYKALKIPRCVKKQSLKKFLLLIEDQNYPDFGEDWDEEKEEEELKKAGKWNAEHPIMKRTAIEQSQDISALFKKIKQEVKSSTRVTM